MEIQDRYELICALDSHGKQKDKCYGSINGLGGRPFPNTSSKMAPKLISDKINFIESWLKMLEKYIWCCNTYESSMK